MFLYKERDYVCIYKYIFIHVCVCVCVRERERERERLREAQCSTVQVRELAQKYPHARFAAKVLCILTRACTFQTSPFKHTYICALIPYPFPKHTHTRTLTF
jgi:hypothetical protein